MESIEATFRQRRGAQGIGAGSDAEPMLAQIADLNHRLARLKRTAIGVLDAEEVASDWLLKKAWKRVWHDGPHQKTCAMMETPRRRLERRALRGYWSEFPVSPGDFEGDLQRHVGPGGYIDYRMVGVVARMLASEVSVLAAMSAEPGRLALFRAAMTVVIEAMDHADDSLAELADAFATFEDAYLQLARRFLAHEVVLRDLLELTIWEDYGLVRDVEGFLRGLPEHHGDFAIRHLARIIAELRAADLGSQLTKAVELRAVVLASADAFPPEEDGDHQPG